MFTLAISCKKSFDSQDAGYIKPSAFTSKAEVKTYLNKQLQTYATVFAGLAKDPEVRYLVHQNIANKFDGDDNVLIKDLIINAAKQGVDLKAKFDQILKTADPSTSGEQLLNSLNDINTRNIYPHIYIPNFEKFNLTDDNLHSGSKKTQSINQGNGLEYPYPIMVAYDGDETMTQNYYEGYTYTEQGTMIENIPVDEEFADENEVWVITPNENVNNDGLMVAPPSYDPLASNITERPDLYFTNMTIKDHKESWLKGASEICMFAGISWDSGIDPSTGLFKTSFRTEPGLVSLPDRNNVVNNIYIRQFRRDEVSDQANIAINFTYFPLSTELYGKTAPCNYLLLRTNYSLQQNLLDYNACTSANPSVNIYFYPEKGDYLYYTIYEYDTGLFGQVGEKIADIAGNGYTQKIYYQSNESAYVSGRLKITPKNQPTQAYENTGWGNINNNTISFNARHR